MISGFLHAYCLIFLGFIPDTEVRSAIFVVYIADLCIFVTMLLEMVRDSGKHL